jgi:hypothetical protein
VLFDFLADATVFWKFMGFTPKRIFAELITILAGKPKFGGRLGPRI